eukprot:TRINITY_DN6213_c0_g1_i1.p1 TRINITY_DN6213_c0_g1~~TRINITY_DN6213_c0_g1_i1.p1  ORF type:complete len:165 (-),score=82.00 TRINITY_DN6213_c0_g1_i1:27-521(-)
MTEENYTWTQTLVDVTVSLPVDANLRGKDFDVKFTKNHLQIKLKPSGTILLDGDLWKNVKTKDCFWTKDGGVLTVELQKEKGQEWWSCVILGHSQIDTSSIEPENTKMSDLDAESRATVQKMMFDQMQKAKGLPTADQLQKESIMQQFMAQHPELDFSDAKLNF